ncbi:MAG TPA: carboxymuconolactone decarboxylase family protein [Candidatus Binatia bacterium]|nr:carboxymuconolactone decarboxylase family protein [Candidatus Binatia bacterium]
MGNAIPVPIDKVLAPEQIAALKKGYTSAAMTEILSGGMPGLDRHTAKYIHAIRRAFYDTSRMAPKDRERCLIGILAGRDAGLNFAIHVYVGLMEGLTPDEIADVIFLGGIYTGVDHLSDGLAAAQRTLTVLGRVAKGDCTILQVMGALVMAFRPPLPPETPPKS